MSLALATMRRELNFEGKTWVMKPPTLEVTGFFEDYLNREMADMTDRLYAGKASHREALRLTLEDVHARKWEWLQPAMMQCLQSVKHVKELIFMMLQQEHREKMDREIIDRLEKDEAKWAEAVGYMWEILLRKNSQGPAAAEAGEPSPAAK